MKNSGMGALGRFVFNTIVPYVRGFDYRAARRVTHFIANSHFIQQRIQRCYGRDSTVIYPPVAVDDFSPIEHPEDFYLVVSELVPYKRVDLGFSKVVSLRSDAEAARKAGQLESLWIGLEILNVLAANNVAGYSYVQDLNGLTYAVPNYLSQRLVNLRVIARF